MVAGQVEVPSIVGNSCSSVLLPPKTNYCYWIFWPSMWPEWLLDLKQIMNHPQISVMISNQDKDFLSYKLDLKVSEGG